MTKFQLFLMLVCCCLTQKPCTSFLNNESGCIATLNYSCAWNQLLSSCQSSTSQYIGCNISLNMYACINQIAYPNDNWAYCRFSGYCREVTGDLTTCDRNLSVAACLATTEAKCAWQDSVCVTISDQTAINLQASQTYNDDLKYSSVRICQGISSFPAVHSFDAESPLQDFYNTFSSTNPTLALLYKNQMDTPGCLVPDGNLLGRLNCNATGLNRLACMQITTSGQLCVFRDGKCQNSTDPSQIQCSDPINQQACLSVTDYRFPCYWHENQCKQLVMTASIACNTYKIGAQTIQVSPSFCSANISLESDASGTECFYNSKKFRCHSMCRAKSTKTDSKACRQSSFGCTFLNNTCTFKNYTSQCGILGQNKIACMNAGENCQFLNGFCTKIQDVTSVNCKDNLNKKACISVTKKGQQCKFEKNQCIFYKATFYDSCEDLTDVNLNVCQRVNDQTCYWVNGSCSISTNQPCTAIGLNRTGCLTTKNTLSPCQWVAESGTCTNVNVVVNVTPCNLQLVNDLACRSIQTRKGIEDVKCQYNSDSFSCEVVTDLASINCSTVGINRAACVSMTDPQMACRWVQGSCAQVAQSLANIRCSSLMGVTQRTCTMVTAENEPCTYTIDGNRCTASVEKYHSTCEYPGLNAYGCAFLDNGKSCYFDDNQRSCIEITNLNEAVLNTLECSKGFTNKQACLLIKTPGQRCQWDDYKKQCISFVFPTYESCDTLTNAGVNLCVGFENDVSTYIDEFSYCTPDTDPTSCKLYSDSTTLTDCGSSVKINLHGCVALSGDTNPCYFDLVNFQCTKLEDENSNDILSTILCKQAGQYLCPKIFTPDQACTWNAVQKKCYYNDQCNGKDTEVECMAVPQACVYASSKCSLILTSMASSYKCSDTNYKFNMKSCLAIQGEACLWDGSVCTKVTPYDTNDCATYDGDSNKYNPVTCGLIKKEGEKCMHNKATQKCKAQIANQCTVGQNEQNCLQENGCLFTEGICSKLPFDCDTAKSLDNCRLKQNPCMWKISENKCKPSPENENCSDYTTDGVSYNEYTCNQISGSDDQHICSSIQGSSGNYECQDIVNVKCSNGTDSDSCRLIKNNCEYTTVCKTSNKIAKKCTEYFTKYSCLSDKNLYCQWSETEYCIDWDYDTGTCGKVDNTDDVESNVSTQVCYAFGCYFDKTVLKCIEDSEIALSCETAKSPGGCQVVQLNCYWDSDSKCKLLNDLNKAKKFSFNQVYYSNKTICLMPQNEGVLTQYTDTCQSPDVNEVLCSANLNVRACEAVATDGQLCIYTNDKCLYATISSNLCSDTLNIYSCVAITTDGQYCVWLGQKCAFLTDDGFTINKYGTVNQHSCKRTYTVNGILQSSLPQIGVKFSLTQMGCIYSDPLVDKCNTPGLNYFGCLNTQVDRCTWSANKCIPFTDPGTYTTCKEYRQVSARVCESISTLLCYYSNYSCADATKKLSCNQSLSQQACIVQLNASCMWKDNKCQTQPILNGVTTCASGTNKVAEYSSVQSCALISSLGQICRHEGNGCTTDFDPLIHGCSTPGLNLDGCVSITIEKCIFQNNQCQVYQGSEKLCRNLVNVNAIVCASLDTENQPCKFSKVKNGCLESVGNDLCTTQGLNKVGCKQITACNWNPDDSQCYCVATTYVGKFCSNLNQNECSYETKCMYDETLKQCRIIRCEDQSITNCQNRVINKSQCYIQSNPINLIESCVSAKSCNDVKNVPDCSQINIMGQQCVPHIDTQCSAQTCESISNDSLCSGKCVWNGFSCSTKKCSYITVQQLCTGSYNNESCTWRSGFCVGLSVCQQYNTLTEDPTINQSLCQKAIILNYQCRWQQDAPYSQTYECSSNPCKPLGSSKINCEGAEIYDQVCVLTSDYNCISCNGITDDCQCTQHPGNCLWSKGTCRSVTCNSLSYANCLVFTEKCMWYEKDKSCLVTCGKLKETNCIEMQSLSLCYWDTSLLRCNAGVPTVAQVDTVSSQLLPEGEVVVGYLIKALILLYLGN